MELERFIITKEKNIIRITEKHTNRQVYTDVSTGAIYDEVGAYSDTIPQLFHDGTVELDKAYHNGLFRGKTEDKNIYRLVIYIFLVYRDKHDAFTNSTWETVRETVIPFYEKVLVLGIELEDMTYYNPLMEMIKKVKLTQDFVDWIKKNNGGRLSPDAYKKYIIERKYRGIIKDILLVYPEVMQGDIDEQISILLDRVDSFDYIEWIFKCLTHSKLAVCDHWLDMVRRLFNVIEKDTRYCINHEQDFFRNYIRIMLEKQANEDADSRVKLAKILDKKYLCDLSEFGLIMTFPTCQHDFFEEGKANENCVGSYYSEVLNREGGRIVAFIRKIDSPNVPYITCDIIPEQYVKLNQFRTKHNEDAQRLEIEAYRKLSNHLNHL